MCNQQQQFSGWQRECESQCQYVQWTNQWVNGSPQFSERITEQSQFPRNEIRGWFSDSQTTQQFPCRPARSLLSSTTELRKERISWGSDSIQYVHSNESFIRTNRSRTTQHYFQTHMNDHNSSSLPSAHCPGRDLFRISNTSLTHDLYFYFWKVATLANRLDRCFSFVDSLKIFC